MGFGGTWRRVYYGTVLRVPTGYVAITLYLLLVVVVGLASPVAVLASAVARALWDFLIPPHFTFYIAVGRPHAIGDVFVVAIAMGQVTSAARDSNHSAAAERRTDALRTGTAKRARP
jgi:hypothetical protein